MHALAAATFLASALSGVSASPVSKNTRRDVLVALPGGAHEIDLKFQPWMDFDTDSCYNTATIDPDGDTNPGLDHPVFKNPQDDCRESSRLKNANVYSRSRCNHGWCAVMYEYYFEKDQVVWGSLAGGHTHDWENVIVFAKGDEVKKVAPSCHGGYGGSTDSPRLGGDTHPKVVYHKDGGSTHCMRMANEGDDDVENYTEDWVTSPLVGWGWWPTTDNGRAYRDLVYGKWPNDATAAPKFWDADDMYTNTLRKAAGDCCEDFDPSYDDSE
ncbi:hypothetical protein NCS57_00866500 [Fusarium keratoplasticum]|uniref:Uncharacterized protein n=1 Tax=Fusarium keratoplasticum TaxID=1328300 RepID=A0ACC0QTE6_9HYPO|nr:hypothetical protein NCS57_00866500 [Fusarium keratoplasticum]KAI8666419.1 hypothetical protein NCS57_00866500 [Fusarium keratoplasticum]